MEQIKQGKGLNFKTNVLLKNVLGKDLINDDNIAVMELVKNSYDAAATKISILFQNIKVNDDERAGTFLQKTTRTSRIIVADNGKGMTREDIEWKWLNIAYSEKKAKREEFGRVFSGNKGVGRFSCDRLGEFLDLYTKTKDGKLNHLPIDWNLFEIENQKDLAIQSVVLEAKEIPLSEFTKATGILSFEHGTVLVISKLRSPWARRIQKKKELTWDARKLIDLRKSLEKLLNPNLVVKKGSAELFLVADEFAKEDLAAEEHEKINGHIRNKIFEKLDFKTTAIDSMISNDGSKIVTSLKDKGREVFRLEERNTRFPDLKNVKIVIYYLSTYSKVYFHRQTGMRSINFGSVHLFINGFRVPPYGDVGNDWLGIDRRKQQGYADILGTREIVGRIEIDDPNGLFRIVSSREGIVANESFRQLVGNLEVDGYFDRTIRRLERYVVDGLRWDRVLESDKTIEKRIFMSTSKSFDQDREIYVENQDQKDRRVIGLISSIVNSKTEEILSLWINPELVLKLQGEERERLVCIFGDFDQY